MKHPTLEQIEEMVIKMVGVPSSQLHPDDVADARNDALTTILISGSVR